MNLRRVSTMLGAEAVHSEKHARDWESRQGRPLIFLVTEHGATRTRFDGRDNAVARVVRARAAELWQARRAVQMAARVLRRAEWSARDGRDNDACCPACREWECTFPHATDCELAKLIGAEMRDAT